MWSECLKGIIKINGDDKEFKLQTNYIKDKTVHSRSFSQQHRTSLKAILEIVKWCWRVAGYTVW